MKFNISYIFRSKANRILLVLSILFLFLNITASAQEKDTVSYDKSDKTLSSLFVEARVFYGFLNNYHNELRIFNAHIPAFELSLLKSTTGKNNWKSLYNYPEVGISLFYTSFSRSDALGNAFGVYPHINFPLLKTTKQNLKFRIGLGLAYLDSKFHPTENYQNLAIGSSVNALAHFMLNYQLRLNNKNSLSIAFSLIHFSNGSITTPNYGLNLPMASLSYSYQIIAGENGVSATALSLFHYVKNKNLRLDIQSGWGIKSQTNIFNKRFHILTQSFTLFKTINKKSSVGIGLDFSWDSSYEKLFLDEGLPPPSGLDFAKYAIAANYEMRLNKLAMKIGFGTYIYAKEKTEGPIYEKLALNYLFYKNIYASVELKAHAARAAYIAWGIGYQLHFKTKKP